MTHTYHSGGGKVIKWSFTSLPWEIFCLLKPHLWKARCHIQLFQPTVPTGGTKQIFHPGAPFIRQLLYWSAWCTSATGLCISPLFQVDLEKFIMLISLSLTLPTCHSSLTLPHSFRSHCPSFITLLWPTIPPWSLPFPDLAEALPLPAQLGDGLFLLALPGSNNRLIKLFIPSQ